MLATLFVIVIGKSVAAFAIVRFWPQPAHGADHLPPAWPRWGVLLHPGWVSGSCSSWSPESPGSGAGRRLFLHRAQSAGLQPGGALAEAPSRATHRWSHLTSALAGHVVVVGADEIGQHLIRQLHEQGREMVVIDTDERLLAPGAPWGSPGGHPIQQDLLTAALPNASWLLITLDDSLLAGEIAIRAQEYGALMRIAACAHQHEEVHHLRVRGACIRWSRARREAARRLCHLAMEMA